MIQRSKQCKFAFNHMRVVIIFINLFMTLNNLWNIERRYNIIGDIFLNGGTIMFLVTPSKSGLTGRPIQIVKVAEKHSFELIEENLQSVLNRPDVRQKKVVVVSVAGAFRKGKSFLLNFFIRYLNYVIGSEVWQPYCPVINGNGFRVLLRQCLGRVSR